MYKLFISFLIVFGAFSSCKKNETVEDITADVFVRSLNYNGILAYSVVHSVTSYEGMSKVTVDVPGGTSFNLSDLYNNGLVFFKDTSMAGSGYTQEPPAPGVYTYRVTFKNGEEKIYTNSLASNYLLPPVIDSLYKKPDGISLRLKWQPVAGADAYRIRISSGQNEILPWVEFIEPQFYYERLISNFSPWLPGTLTFEVRAVDYEQDEYRIQSMSYTSSQIDL